MEHVMVQDSSAVPWTEEQWNQVQQTVRDEARKVRVGASFLPLYGPLPADAESVPLQDVYHEDTGETRELGDLADFLRGLEAQAPPYNFGDIFGDLADRVTEVEHSSRRLRGESRRRLRVNDTRTRPLSKISVNVYVKNAQLRQPDLSSALIMFRRAANIIARVEDRIIFGGQPRPDPPPEDLRVQPPIFRVTGGEQFLGLIETANDVGNCIPIGIPDGRQLVSFVAQAITRLEDQGHLAPFALVLGPSLFITAYTPDPGSLVLPADRIIPQITGPLLRSSTIEPREGILVSLAGDPVDLVVASEISAKFIQVTMEPRWVFRVSERMTLRIKQPPALMSLVPNCPP